MTKRLLVLAAVLAAALAAQPINTAPSCQQTVVGSAALPTPCACPSAPGTMPLAQLGTQCYRASTATAYVCYGTVTGNRCAVPGDWATATGGASVIACVGTPGNTAGAYRQQCQTAAGAIFACNNAAGCTVAADWGLVGPGTGGPPTGAAGGDLGVTPYPNPKVVQMHDTVTSICYTGGSCANAGATYAVALADTFIPCDATLGAITINLPAATGSGREISVKKTDASANACTPTRAGSDTIDGSSTAVAMTAQNSAIKLIDSAAGAWYRSHVNQLGGELSGTNVNATVIPLACPSAPTTFPAAAYGKQCYVGGNGVYYGCINATGCPGGADPGDWVEQTYVTPALRPPGLGLVAWWSGDGVTGVTNGGSITSVPDLTGNGYTATAAGAMEPTLTTNALNGHAALTFSGSQCLQHSYDSAFPGTVFVVGSNTKSGYADFLSGDATTAGYAAWSFRANTPGSNSAFVVPLGSDVSQALLYSPVLANNTILIATLSGSTINLYTNGGNLVATKTFTGTPLIPSRSASIGCGFFANTTTDYLAGNILEAGIYSTVLTQAQITELDAYLRNKYYPQPSTGTYIQPTFWSNSSPEYYRLSTSTDGLTWTDLQEYYLGPTGSLRDPNFVYYNGQWLMAYTENNGLNGLFGLAQSPDLTYFKLLQDVDASASGTYTNAWAPRLFIDPADSSLHVIVSLSSTGYSPGNFQLYEMHPTSTALTAWSTPLLLNLGAGRYIDPFVVVANGVYNLWYSVSGYLAYATASSLTGTYTIAHTGNWAGWGGSLEGPNLIHVANKWRIYWEPQSGAGQSYSESTDSWVTWSAAAPTTASPVLQRGTVFRISDLWPVAQGPAPAAISTGNVSGPATTTNGYVPQWNNTTGTLLNSGLPVSATPGANTIPETGSGGTLATGWLPSGTPQTVAILTPVVDCLCAHGSDSTIVVNNAVQLAYVPVGVLGAGGSGYTNADTWTGTGGTCVTEPAGILAVTGGSIMALTVTTIGVCSVFPTGITATSGGSGSTILFSSCNNSSDAILGNFPASDVFASTYTILGGSLSPGNQYSVLVDFAEWSPSTAEKVSTFYLMYGTNGLNHTGSSISVSASLTGNTFSGKWHTTLSASNYFWSNLDYLTIPQSAGSGVLYGTTQPVNLTTSASHPLGIGMYFNNHGVASAVCNDAGNACGLTGLGSNTAGTTVKLQTFNGTSCAGVLGTVYLTGTGVIANGTPIYITNTGTGCTTTATTAAYASGGTATGVSGAATITSVLGGSQGNSINIGNMTVKKEN